MTSQSMKTHTLLKYNDMSSFGKYDSSNNNAKDLTRITIPPNIDQKWITKSNQAMNKNVEQTSKIYSFQGIICILSITLVDHVNVEWT